MTPKQVRSLLAVHQYGSINKASEILHLAPSSISAQLKELSNELGVTLFENKGRNILLNKTGLNLLPHLQSFCAQESQIKALANSYQANATRKLRLFAPSSLCIYRLPHLIEKLQVKAPEIEIELVHEPFDYLTALRQADIEAAIIMTDCNKLARLTQDWHSKSLAMEEIIYVASPEYGHFERPMTLTELSHHALITTEEACHYRQAAIQHFSSLGLTLTPKQSFSNVEVIKRCLLAKMGIGLLPKCVVAEEIELGKLYQVPVEGAPYAFQSHLVYSEQSLCQQLEASLLSCL